MSAPEATVGIGTTVWNAAMQTWNAAQPHMAWAGLTIKTHYVSLQPLIGKVVAYANTLWGPAAGPIALCGTCLTCLWAGNRLFKLELHDDRIFKIFTSLLGLGLIVSGGVLAASGVTLAGGTLFTASLVGAGATGLVLCI